MRESVDRYGAPPRELELEDLALATACARGIEAAWEDFHRAYRQFLVDASGDRDIADQVIGELYQGQIARFRGRSSLKGWLRAIVHQAQIDHYRRVSRLTDLETMPVEPGLEEHPEDFERLENARTLAGALRAEAAQLPPDQRLLLSCYYVDRMRLAEIARLRRVHESTVSRDLDAIRKRLRKQVEKRLRSQGFSSARIEECFRNSTDAPVELEEMLQRARKAG